MKSILDPKFKYVPAAGTDIRATFRRIRREQREAAERERLAAEEAARIVTPIAKRRGT